MAWTARSRLHPSSIYCISAHQCRGCAVVKAQAIAVAVNRRTLFKRLRGRSDLRSSMLRPWRYGRDPLLR